MLITSIVGLGQGLAPSLLAGRVRIRVLVVGHGWFAAGYGLLLLAAATPGPGATTLVVLTGVAAYTLGEVTASPITSTIAAEAAPEALRGKYLTLNQLAVSGAAALTPVALTGLLAHGTAGTWLTLIGVSALGAGMATAAGAFVTAAQTRVGHGAAHI